MKKIFALVLCLAILGLCGCKDAKEPPVTSSQEAESQEVQSEEVKTGPQESVKFKLEGIIEQATDFSNGYAIVKTEQEDDQNYWVNKKGEVLAVLPTVVFSSGQTYPAQISEIASGFVLVSDYSTEGYTTLCDIEGNVYTAEDFGVTAFHPDALSDGYIITSTIEEDGTAKIGVLDCELLWVLQDREDIARYMGFKGANGPQKIGKIYADYKVFGEVGGFDVRNGSNFSKTASDLAAQIASDLENWELNNGIYGYTYGGKYYARVNLAKLANLDYDYMTLEVEESKFVDGKAPVIFGNHDKQTKFSLIDSKGNMVFEPVNFKLQIEKIMISDGYILVVGEKDGKTVLKTYDLSGKSKGKFSSNLLGGSAEFSFVEGVIRIEQSDLTAEGVERTTTLYNADFEKLF